MKPYDDLTMAAAEVAGSASWNKFTAAFRVYRDDQLLLLSLAPPDKLAVFQGRAQGLNDLLMLFENCRDRARMLQERTSDAG